MDVDQANLIGLGERQDDEKVVEYNLFDNKILLILLQRKQNPDKIIRIIKLFHTDASYQLL